MPIVFRSDSKFYKVRPSTNGSSANYRPLAQQEKTSSGGDRYCLGRGRTENTRQKLVENSLTAPLIGLDLLLTIHCQKDVT